MECRKRVINLGTERLVTFRWLLPAKLFDATWNPWGREQYTDTGVADQVRLMDVKVAFKNVTK